MLLLRLTLFFGLLCSVAACSSPAEPGPPPCDGGQITLAPTATRPTDPDLFAPPAPPTRGPTRPMPPLSPWRMWPIPSPPAGTPSWSSTS